MVPITKNCDILILDGVHSDGALWSNENSYFHSYRDLKQKWHIVKMAEEVC